MIIKITNKRKLCPGLISTVPRFVKLFLLPDTISLIVDEKFRILVNGNDVAIF